MLDLGRELIGAVGLGFFWIHTLLIAGAAVIDQRELGRIGRGRIRAGIVKVGRGPDGGLARHVTEQIGRSKGDGVVHFHDAAHRSELLGGSIRFDDGTELELEPTMSPTDTVVWPEHERRVAAASPASVDVVERALTDARRARGFTRSVEVVLGVEQRVWVIEREASTPATPPVVISAIDPHAWLAKQRRMIVGFITAELALASACTALILWPPLFGWVSAVGALAALGLFLAVQPIGVTVHDAVRTPDRAYLRGRWG